MELLIIDKDFKIALNQTKIIKDNWLKILKITHSSYTYKLNKHSVFYMLKK